MSEEPATSDSWQTHPMSETRARLQCDRTFSADEYARLKLGFVPKEMEERWFIYLENDRLYFHRSWTGHGIFEVRLEPVEDGYRIAEAWVNRDPEQYVSDGDADDLRLLTDLTDWLLVDRNGVNDGQEQAERDRRDARRSG